MQLDVVDITGKKVGQIEVADQVFGRPTEGEAGKTGEGLLWEVVKAQRAARRAGTHSTKRRGEVSGGGKKPHAQKGTGGARQGSTRSPQFVGGGGVFTPKPRDYSYTVPKKVKRAALATALSLRAKENKLVIVDALQLAQPKTKQAAEAMLALGVDSAVVVDARENSNLNKSVRNLPEYKYLAPEGLNVYDILNHPALVITKDAVRAVEARVLPTVKDAAEQ